MEFLEDIFTLVTGTVTGWIDAFLKLLGRFWYPLHSWINQQPADALIYIVGTLALFGLAICLQLWHWHQLNHNRKLAQAKKRSAEKLERMPFLISFGHDVLFFFYPFILMWFGLQFGDVRPGADPGGFGITGGVSTLTFINFTEWGQMSQVIAASALLWFLCCSLACVLRLRPMDLLRFWVQSLAFAWLGQLVNLFLRALQDLGWLINLLVQWAYIFLTMVLPFWFVVVAMVPLYMVVFMFIGPVILFLSDHIAPKSRVKTQTVVRHSDGSEQVLIDENGNFNDWVYLFDVLLFPW